MSGKKDGKVLEPTAGNGMLVFAVPANQVHVNELDETRLDNLREQGLHKLPSRMRLSRSREVNNMMLLLPTYRSASVMKWSMTER